MELEIYFKCVVACLLGNVCHICLKILSLEKDYRKANEPFTLGFYFKQDKYPLIGDLIFSLSVVYLVDEFITHVTWVSDYFKSMFFLIGFSGSYLILYFLSSAEKKLRQIIDDKTNELDKLKDKQ